MKLDNPFPPERCNAWEDCNHDGLCHDPSGCGGVGPNNLEEGEVPDPETTMVDAITKVLCSDVRDCLADYEVSEEVVRNDPEFGASMRLTAEHIMHLIQNGDFAEEK